MNNALRTSNPALLGDAFARPADGPVMTLQGTINKTGLLLLIVIAGAVTTWDLAVQQSPLVMPFLGGGLLVGFIVALVTTFKREWSPVTAPLYAVCEGLALGGLSSLINLKYPGIAIQAVALTFGTLFAMLFIYKTGIIKVTRNFALGVAAATGGIMLFYFAVMILGFFHVNAFGSVFGSGPIGIGFSLFVVAIAALNLVLDFAFVEQGVAYGAPKYMEWYSAFGIMVTLVWLYLEMLRLLSKLNGNRR